MAPAATVAARTTGIASTGRIAGIDLARGLAVIGMLAAHLVTTEDLVWGDPSTWSGIVDGRSSILFAVVAGVSIALLSGGGTPVTGPARRVARRRLLVRAVLIWVLGVFLLATGVPVYVILPAYAVLFLLAIPFLGLAAPRLWGVAALIALTMPWVQPALNALPLWASARGAELADAVGWHYPFTVWLAFIVAGMAIGRSNLRALSTQVTVTLVGVALAVVGYALHPETPAESSGDYWGLVLTAEPHSSGLLEVIGSGGFALAVIGACLLVCRTPVRHVLLPIRAIGSMPLTAYTGQIVAWAVWAQAQLGTPSDLVGFRALDPFWPFVVTTAVFCTAWALVAGRGPLERVVTAVARLVVPPASPRDADRLER